MRPVLHHEPVPGGAEDGDEAESDAAVPPLRILVARLCPKADWSRMTDAAIIRLLRLPLPRARERLEYAAGYARGERREDLPPDAPLSMRAGHAAGLSARRVRRRRAGRRREARP